MFSVDTQRDCSGSLVVFRGDYPHRGTAYVTNNAGKRIAIFMAFGDQDTEGAVTEEYHRNACVDDPADTLPLNHRDALHPDVSQPPLLSKHEASECDAVAVKFLGKEETWCVFCQGMVGCIKIYEDPMHRHDHFTKLDKGHELLRNHGGRHHKVPKKRYAQYGYCKKRWPRQAYA